MRVQLLGINHQTAPLELREAVALDASGAASALRAIAADAAISEAAILATCNRTELYVRTPDAPAAEAAMRGWFDRCAGGREVVEPHTYLHTDGEAARHLMRVAAGLDSMILGEHQILGQVRDAHAVARAADTLGPLLDRLFSSAIHAGKRARAETDIGTGAVSVASAAVNLAERVFGDLRDRVVMVVGAGETGRLAARQFGGRRPSRLLIANRTIGRAAALAAEIGGEALGLDQLAEALPAVDVVVSATGSPGFVLTHAMVRSAVAVRPQRPLVLIDIAVPRDIEPSIGTLSNVFLYPIDALRTLVDKSLERRLHEVPRVAAIVDEECEKLMMWTRGLRVSPVVRELTEHFERVRAEEVRRSLRHFHPEEEAYLERMTKGLVNRLLRAPITRLKAGDSAGAIDPGRLEMVRDLFALDTPALNDEADRDSR